MGTKVWIALCALLLINSGHAEHNSKIKSPSEAALTETTDQSTTQPSVPPSESHALATDTPHALPTAGPTHTTQPTNVNTTTTMPPTTHPAALPPDFVTPSNQPTHNKTHSSTPIPISEPPKPETTTTFVAQSSSTSGNSSSQKPPNPELPTLTSPQQTLQSDGHPETSSEAHHKPTINPPSGSSAQANARADTPSQLNVGGDPTMVHDSPTLDPLLAGLVSAFIITAVIITLLLFLKLRQRDNRPEFRRLQDLPMDDMMEDTPLSMYSY
ncbi:proline-rich receptor-like protein kinase PERK2 isoform X2 [Etheostoma cragini]|uniref:proline-rich receptor-like protein kinase PERK2 isoform X2 n=1 Tax=Etheostoma cragini TaxID=417921 RepID=UPI00155E71CA|nr:proline-rich receptor-like protein kinase PERK2 isoform X2 [Etheostoma cragini]